MCKAFAVSALVFVFGANFTEATTYTVPTDFASIQDAIDAAEPGDTVRVEAGEYDETVQLKSGVSLLGAGRELATIYATPDRGPVISALRCDNAVVRGFTLKHVTGDEVGRAVSDKPPVVLVNNASITIEDCEIFGGTVSGIRCELGGDSTIDNCFLHDNTWNGVLVRWGARATIRNSKCTNNGRSGISFYLDGNGVAENNTLSDNRTYGISVVGESSEPKLSGNRCIKNGRDGIYFADEAGGVAEGNTCEENGKNGISVSGVKTRPFLSRNSLERNKVAGIGYGRGASAKQLPAKAKDEIDKEQLAAYLEAENFEELEAIAGHIRDEKLRYSDGEWQLHSFYDALVPKEFRKKPGDAQGYFDRLERWSAQYPDSVTWRIVAAHAHADIGWSLRGSSWASEVTDKGRAGMKEHLNLAWEFLEGGHHLAGHDPELYVNAISVAMGLSKEKSEVFDVSPSDRKTAKNLMERLFLLGAAIEPTYNPLYYKRAISLLPRWGGEPGELERFAERTVNKIGVYEGETMYARIAYLAMDLVGSAVYLDRFKFSWLRIKQGNLNILERYPASTQWIDRYAYLACLHKDMGTARGIFEQFGESWDKKFWATNYHHERWKNWADGAEAYPLEDIPLQAANSMGNKREFLRLLREGRDPNWVNERGQSVLYLAVRSKNIEAVRWLIDKGADMNVTSALGWTILQRSRRTKDLEIFELLLEAGADPEIRNSNNTTALYSCASGGNIEMAKILIEYGADVNVAVERGWQPLHVAVWFGRSEMVELLLDEGVDINVPIQKGLTPLALSQRRGHADISKLLEDRGASS
ncbi:MAG: ankyrin repeat domain-containing protein [Candidatus Hydrogenedentes bacterium]|nr:ankyrin repeat domain-containing protein [Candidatus Hydrogenedentota bacterium]